MSTILVSFADAWLTDAANPTVSVHASFPERGQAATLDGEVRHYAGGRRRVITTARRSATFPLTLQLLGDDDLAQVIAWQGSVLLLRDGEGRRIFGTFLAVDVKDYWDPDGPLHEVSLTFSEVDFVEGLA